jgi:hypothetical protein
VGGLPSIVHVLKALGEVHFIDRVCVIGPKEELDNILDQYSDHVPGHERLDTLEQKENLFTNVWHAFRHLLEQSGQTDRSGIDKSILFVPGDIPLVTSWEIDHFLSQCNPAEHDYFLGVTTEESLRPFYPTRDDPGIKMEYFHVKEKKYRQNNLHVVKPFRVSNADYIQKVYDFRYQQEFLNMCGLAWEFVKAKVGLRGLRCYGLLHLSLLLSRMHLEKLTWVPRRFASRAFVESCISRALGTRFVTIEVPLGGAALDIDNQRDYEALRTMFPRWRAHVIELADKMRTSFKTTGTADVF